jgi:hypothetical protein
VKYCYELKFCPLGSAPRDGRPRKNSPTPSKSLSREINRDLSLHCTMYEVYVEIVTVRSSVYPAEYRNIELAMVPLRASASTGREGVRGGVRGSLNILYIYSADVRRSTFYYTAPNSMLQPCF